MSALASGPASAAAIAASVNRHETSALARARSPVTDVKQLSAGLWRAMRASARRVDADIAAGKNVGPLAGVPFAVKNLFDVAGLTTIAGSKINRDLPPATHDAPLIARLEANGAILVGALNMGEYAYDFTGENVHDGPSRNPHDVTRMTGGSSGGSGGAVASGLVPLTLGSDTNGSIRVPASFCGIFGLKPTYGRLSRAGTFPFVSSFDHLGPLARTTEDLALAYDAMQGADPADPVQAPRPDEPSCGSLHNGIAGLRLAIAGGYFEQGRSAAASAAMSQVARALGATWTIHLPEVARARAAAYIITAAEGSALHLDRLRERAGEFDPAVRDRLLAGAMIPAGAVIRAQKLRRWYQRQVLALFQECDIILAPATPCTAPKLGDTLLDLGTQKVLLRPNIGLFTQPFSFIGLPVVTVPVQLSPLPIGVQIVAAPWREDLALRVAHHLERAGVVHAKALAAFS